MTKTLAVSVCVVVLVTSGDGWVDFSSEVGELAAFASGVGVIGMVAVPAEQAWVTITTVKRKIGKITRELIRRLVRVPWSEIGKGLGKGFMNATNVFQLILWCLFIYRD